MQYFVSNPFYVCNHLAEGERAGCFNLIAFWQHVTVSVLRLFLKVLSHGAVGWSTVCDCGISWSYSLTFCAIEL